MKDTKNIDDHLPIEILQKGIIITEESIKNNPILKLTVINNIIISNLYRKQKAIFFQIIHS